MVDRGDNKRVEVGFAGGQSIVVRITEDAYDNLRRAAQDARGWHEVDTADGLVALDARQIVFVKGESSEHRIGFSGSA